MASFIKEIVALFNGTSGDPHSFDLLEHLLAEQPYRLAYWRVASDESWASSICDIWSCSISTAFKSTEP